jgi:hypothetical protein
VRSHLSGAHWRFGSPVQVFNMDGSRLLNFFPLSSILEESPGEARAVDISRTDAERLRLYTSVPSEKFTFARGIAACPITGHLAVGESSRHAPPMCPPYSHD